MKLKVCGMKYRENLEAVAQLQPAYLGFIFWRPSARCFEGEIPSLPNSIKKAGVFVDATVDEVVTTVIKHDLQAVQLHGSETPEYCEKLQERHAELVSASHDKNLEHVQVNGNIEIIKVFSIKGDFDFSVLEPYESVCDYFLFDTKGKLPGGNGYRFDWKVLNNYPSQKPFFLSGGIGLEEVDEIRAILNTDLPIHAIDVNSQFETTPGLKKIKELEIFKHQLAASMGDSLSS